MINQRLFDWYNINTSKNLNIRKRCSRPFDTILIDKNGSCYACECTSWLPQSIGNLQLKSLDDIVGSTTHEHLQESILDGTYRYCNENQCAYIKAGWWEESVAVTNIEHLRLAIDDSCNLRCPSCRTKLIFHKEGSQFKKRIELADKINDWLRNLIHPCTVHIGSDGDPFASHVYRYFMEHTPQSSMIRYSFQTNALLFEEFYPKIPHVIKNLTELGVSIDGASKDTYEALRLGGSWNKINKNLECISKLKQQYGFRFIMHFIVQEKNFHEMMPMIELAERVNADRIWLIRIQNWNTFDNFNSQDVCNPAHAKHNIYQKHLKQVIERTTSNTGTRVEIPTLVPKSYMTFK